MNKDLIATLQGQYHIYAHTQKKKNALLLWKTVTRIHINIIWNLVWVMRLSVPSRRVFDTPEKPPRPSALNMLFIMYCWLENQQKSGILCVVFWGINISELLHFCIISRSKHGLPVVVYTGCLRTREADWSVSTFWKKNHLVQFRPFVCVCVFFFFFVFFFLKIKYGFMFRIHFRFNLCIQSCWFHFFWFAQVGLIFFFCVNNGTCNCV